VRHPVCVAATLVVVLLAMPALQAAERIIRYDSDIRIDADASLRVTETIEVYAEGRRIRRGIYRDFPTTYVDRLGNRIRVDLRVLSVRRDGAAEPFSVESLANGVRIRIGRADRFLDTGAHTYTITYHTERQLGFFADYDELYWNVTGNGWGFPIESATAKVTLPGGARAVQQVAYTGTQGAKGRDFRQSVADDVVTWETTRPLDPGEGLTIAVAWPKGFVTAPSGADEAGWFLRDNAATGVALVGMALMLLYYVLAWRRFGKDPEGGAIFPRFEPPEGLSPAATRFIRLMNFDKKAYSAALINMAVKGYLVIEEEEGSYRLLKEPDTPITVLANGERRIAKKLLRTRDSILLDKKHHELLATSVSKLRHSLENEYEKACFARNTVFFVTGLVLSFGVVVLMAMVDGNPARFGPAILVALASAGLTFGVLHFWGDDTDPTFKVLPFRALPVAGALAITLKIGMFVIVAGVSSFGAMVLQFTTNPVQTLCFALLGGLNITFFFLLKRPTLAGRSLMDEIEGFRMYLSVAEEERLKFRHPPDKTPELFEKYLPYALALDVENEWNDQFATILAAASTAPGESTGYRPRWYRGTAWRPGHGGSFSRGLGASLGTAVASSVTAPGSSSGSGGGGSSGGGGGGGGGGGW
jgi:hypothetical protein